MQQPTNPTRKSHSTTKRMDRITQIVLLILSLVYSAIVFGQTNRCSITISGSATSGGSFSGTAPNRVFTPNASTSNANIRVNDLVTQLLTNNVTINTTSTGGNGTGTVTFSSAVSVASTSTSQRTFTINAISINVNAAINLQPATASNGNNGRPASNIAFNATNTISITAPITTTGGTGGGGSGGPGGSGGAITLTSSNGHINVSSDLDCSGGDAGKSNRANGNGATITLSAVNGGITLTAGLTTLAGSGGTGGSAGNFSFTNGSTDVTTGGGTNDGQTGGVISGGNLSKAGVGTLMLAGINTYTGTTTVHAGKLGASATVAASSNGPFGNHAGGLILNGGAVMSNTATFSRPITVSANSSGIDAYGSARTITSTITGTGAFNLNVGGATVSGADGQQLTLTGVISSSGALSLNKSGTSTVILSGTNTYTGTTTISGGNLVASGTVAASTNGPFGNHASGLILNGGTVSSNTPTFSRTITVSASGSGIDAYGSSRTISSAITGTGAYNLNVGGTTAANAEGQQLTLSGVISSSGALSLTKTGNSTVILTGTNTYTGGTTLSAGVFIVGNTQAFGSAAGTLTIAGGILDANASITTVNYPLALNGHVTFTGTNSLNLGTGNITMNGDLQITVSANTLTLGGSLSAATRSLTKAGEGTLNLGSTAKSIHSLTINAGTLVSTSNTLTIAGSFTNNGTFTHNSGTVTYSATGGGQTVGAATYNNLTLSNTSNTNTMAGAVTVGGLLTISGGKLALGSNTLTINGTISGMTASGSLSANGSSSLVFGGSGALGTNLFFDQTTPGTTNRIVNLTYNRSSATITLGDTLEITGTVTPTNGVLATANKLKLISNISGTARVAAGTGTYITGNVTVERYVPSSARRWRFFGSPVASTTLADLKNEIYITGAGGATNGFDATASNAASVYSYDETVITGDLNSGFTAATNITNSITAGKGYRIFIRGDRSDPGRLTGTNTTQNAVTVNLVGALNTGSVSLPVSFTSSGTLANDGWNLVSNPYASAFDWNAFWDAQNATANCTNIDPTIYIFDATSNSYKSYNASSNTGTLTSGIIPSFAAFWVKATAASPLLVLSETYKTTTTPVALFKTNEDEGFKIRLEADPISYDELVIKYKTGASENRDSFDIYKLAAVSVNICAYGNDSQYLSASVRPLVNCNDTIRLGVYATASGNYTLRFFDSEEIAVKENVLLFDTYANTVIDLSVVREYTFAVNASIAASQGNARFYIVVANNTGLPVNLLTFGAQKEKDHTVKLNWSTVQELNNSHFEIERSGDGRTFEKIGEVKGNGNTHKLIEYLFIDNNPSAVNYYRLKQVDFDGTAAYSKTVRIATDHKQTRLELYPVPAVNTLTVSRNEIIQQIRIRDLNGAVKLTQPANSNRIEMDIQFLAPGVYTIEIEGENGSVLTEKFLKQ